VAITKNMPKFELFKSDASALDFIDYRGQSRSFAHMAAMQTNSVNLTGEGEPVRVFGLRVSASRFPMLGVRTLEEPLRRGSGKQVEIDTQKFTVIGVVAPVLQFIEPSRLYVPLAFTPAQLDPHARGHQNLDVLARLKPGATPRPGPRGDETGGRIWLWARSRAACIG